MMSLSGQVVGQVQEAGRDDVDRAVAAARQALKGPWGRQTLEERCQLPANNQLLVFRSDVRG